MFLQKPFDQHAHLRTGRVAFLPVDGAVFSQRVRELLRDGDQLVVLVEVLNGLRLGERIVESELVGCKSELLAFLLCCLYLLCQIQHFFNDLLVCQHSVEILVHRLL